MTLLSVDIQNNFFTALLEVLVCHSEIFNISKASREERFSHFYTLRDSAKKWALVISSIIGKKKSFDDAAGDS